MNEIKKNLIFGKNKHFRSLFFFQVQNIGTLNYN